jgi:hypothetical protein
VIERICIILLANFVFYFKTLRYKYSSDDIPVFIKSRELKYGWWKQLFWEVEGSIRVNEQKDHALTMMLHALTCVFIYTGFGSTDVSFMAALLFSFNPITNQGSVWISGRGYVLPTMLLLMAMSIPWVGPAILILVAYFNIGFLAPLTLVGSEHWWMICFMPLIWMFHVKRFTHFVKDKASKEMFAEDKKIKPEKIVLFTKTFGYYLVNALIPFTTTFYHSFLESAAGSRKHISYSMKCKFFWIGLVAVLSIIAYWIFVPWNMISFGLLWWCMGIAPFCNAFRISQELSERYAYFPTVGLMVALASILPPMAFVAFMAMYATKMWFWMDAYIDDFWLIETSKVHDKKSWFAWHISAMQRWEKKSYTEAMILWTMAKMLSPKEMKILLNLATALKMGGYHKEAEEYLKMAEDNIPEGQEEQAKEIFKNWRDGKYCVVI